MNEELLKIREVTEYSNNTNKYSRIKEKEMLEYLRNLNQNMTKLYYKNAEKKYDEKEFIDCIIENIYNILNIFSEMNVFPGYFFRKVFEMNSKYLERKIDYDSRENSIGVKYGIRGDYRFFNETHLSAWISGEIRTGLNNGYYREQAYPKTNISDAFLEILALFQKFDLPYKISNKDDCQKLFNDISVNYSNISGALLNSDSDYEDIEYLCRLLYEYISFFVAIGVNPKKYLDEYIENQRKEKHK